MVDHLSKRKHDKNQVHVVVLLEINKADGKLFETRVTITDFMKHSA